MYGTLTVNHAWEKTMNESSGADAHTVLVVDDDALITATLSSILRRIGFKVTGLTSPEQALRTCAAEKFDLAIIDQRMPNISGAELARQLRDLHDIYSIIISAYDDAQLVNDAATAGAMAYLVKPVDPSTLSPTIKTALSRVEELRNLRLRETRLREIITAERDINTVVGILMERLCLAREDAFEALRRYARSHRIQLAKAAGDVLRPLDIAHQTMAEIATLTKSMKPRTAVPSAKTSCE